MAPTAIETCPGSEKDKHVPQSKFPDGIKTSGQHPPVYEKLRPYDEFPKSIEGPTVWRTEDYEASPERWTHRFTDDEIAEMSVAVDSFRVSGTPLTGISKVGFPAVNARGDAMEYLTASSSGQFRSAQVIKIS